VIDLAPRGRGRGLASVLALISLLGASRACIAQPSAASGADAASPTVVYVARRGWHIDIGLAAADLPPPLDSIAADLPGAGYIFFGFGDKHYLLAKNHNGPVLLSALWPGAAIMLVTGLSASPDEGFGASHVIRLMLRPEQARALRAFIWNSFETQGKTVDIYRPGPYEGSLYFLAAAKYSAFHTCNTWGAQALRSAGLRVHAKGVVFAGQLWSQVRRLQRTAAQSPRASLLVASSPAS